MGDGVYKRNSLTISFDARQSAAGATGIAEHLGVVLIILTAWGSTSVLYLSSIRQHRGRRGRVDGDVVFGWELGYQRSLSAKNGSTRRAGGAISPPAA